MSPRLAREDKIALPNLGKLPELNLQPGRPESGFRAHEVDSVLAVSAVVRSARKNWLQYRRVRPRVVKKLDRAVGTSLVWSESTAVGHVVPGSSDLLRPIEDGANS